MRLKRVRLQVSKTLKKMGWGPTIRGGSGTGMTVPEKILMNLFPKAKWNYPVPTKKSREITGYPHYYPIDVAFPEIKIGVEADGFSHRGLVRHKSDLRRDKLLKKLGWKILRFSNEQILNNKKGVEEQIKDIISQVV